MLWNERPTQADLQLPRGKAYSDPQSRASEEQGPAEKVVRPSEARTEAAAGFLPIRIALSQEGWRGTSLSAKPSGSVRPQLQVLLRPALEQEMEGRWRATAGRGKEREREETTFWMWGEESESPWALGARWQPGLPVS